MRELDLNSFCLDPKVVYTLTWCTAQYALLAMDKLANTKLLYLTQAN